MIFVVNHPLFAGNPILCNCNLRPLQRWISSQLRVADEWKTFACIDFEESTNKIIYGLPEDQMPCDTSTSLHNNDFELTPDVKFREITRYFIHFNDHNENVNCAFINKKDISIYCKHPQSRYVRQILQST